MLNNYQLPGVTFYNLLLYSTPSQCPHMPKVSQRRVVAGKKSRKEAKRKVICIRSIGGTVQLPIRQSGSNDSFEQICLNFLQAGTGDDFLDDLLSTDASLDDGAVPDVIDSSINMTGHEVSWRVERSGSCTNFFVYFWPFGTKKLQIDGFQPFQSFVYFCNHRSSSPILAIFNPYYLSSMLITLQICFIALIVINHMQIPIKHIHKKG